LAAGALVASAQAPQNWIYQHNGAYQDPNDPNLPNLYYYYVDQFDQTIVIRHGIQGQDFWFDAALVNENGGYDGPGHIASIAADADAGVVAVKIEGSGHEYGAGNAKQITLNQIGVTGVIQDAPIESRSRGLRPAHPSGACGGFHAPTCAPAVSDRGNKPGCGCRAEMF
jgi:hypothetical protein